MKNLYEYINEKLVLQNKTKIRPVHYNDIEDNFEKISDFKSLIDTKYESEHINFYLGNVLSKRNNKENFLCGWSFIEYWDDWAGGIDAPSEFFYIVNEEQFKFFNETHVLKKNKTNEMASVGNDCPYKKFNPVGESGEGVTEDFLNKQIKTIVLESGLPISEQSSI